MRWLSLTMLVRTGRRVGGGGNLPPASGERQLATPRPSVRSPCPSPLHLAMLAALPPRRERRGRVPGASSLRILHLSDLHFGVRPPKRGPAGAPAEVGAFLRRSWTPGPVGPRRG